MKTKVALVCGTLVLASSLVCAAGEPFAGLELRPLGADVASYLGLESGALVGAVVEKSPADAAGLKTNDIILAWNGEAVTSAEDVVAKVKASAPGQDVKVKVLRKGAEHELALKIGTRDGAPAGGAEAPSSAAYLGVAFDVVPALLREYLGLAEGGVYVVEVLEGSPAAKAGLKERDIILTINGKELGAPEELQALMSGMRPHDAVKIEGLRAGRELKVEAVLGERPAGFEKKVRRSVPPLLGPAPAPGAENSKDRFTLRFKDEHGNEHVIPFPGFGHAFSFEMPKIDWPHDLKHEQIQDLEARVKEAMKEAMKQIEEHSRQLKENHGAFLRHVEKLKGAPASDAQLTVSNATSQVMSSDGTHEITIKTENGVKTVTVKEGEKTLAKDLPFGELGSLPESVQKKVKDLDGSVIIKADAQASPAPVPPPPPNVEKPAEKPTEKPATHTPVDVQVPTRTL
jgi:membrane-associated protease RseP (regulator of RpoE activity)